MGSEGWEVVEVLAERGIAAFVLEYRLQPTPESLDGFGDSMDQTFAAASESSGAPPMFNVIAADEHLSRAQFEAIQSWFEAGRPVEFNLHKNGGHGFRLGNPDRTGNRWFQAFVHWLDVNGFLDARPGE